MKSLPGAASSTSSRSRKRNATKTSPELIRAVAHELFNQLSVVNLCSFRLKERLISGSKEALSGDVERLDRAVAEASACAERLSQMVRESRFLSSEKKLAYTPEPIEQAISLFAAELF